MKTLALSALILLLAGCSSLNVVVNLGGTVNLVPVTKVVRDGTMSSATTADEANPSTTTVQIPLPGVK